MNTHFFSKYIFLFQFIFGEFFFSEKVSYLFKDEDFNNTGKSPISVETICVGPPRFVEFAFQDIVMDGNVEVFETEAMQYVIQYLAKYAMYPYYILVTTYFSMLVLFTLGHLARVFYVTEIDGASGPYAYLYPISVFCFSISLCLVSMLIYLESKVMYRQGFNEYSESGWNWLQMCAYFLVILSSVIAIVHDILYFASSTDSTGAIGTTGSTGSTGAINHVPYLLSYNNVLGSVAMAVAWTSCLSYLRGFDMFASIIATLVQILHDLQGFILMIFILVIGMTSAFKVLLPGANSFNNFVSLVTVWNMVNVRSYIIKIFF